MGKMHRALEIHEIAEMICEQIGLPLGAPGRFALRDLVVLARTATIFLNPALNIIWRTQHTILNVLRCMPEDLWDITESDDDFDGITSIRLLRVIGSNDWERPFFYLHRVKFFSICSTFEDADFFEAISLCPPGVFIFPNLERLFWFADPTDSFHHVRLFLAPSITDITLGRIGTVSHVSVLSTLAAKCPSLVKVSIHIHAVQELALATVSTFVRRLAHIELLTVPELDEMAFAHIAELPGLSSLRFNHPAESVYRLPGGTAGFRALTELTTPTMECATGLIAMPLNRPLVKLIILRQPMPPTNLVARQFYSDVAKYCAHASLRHIGVYGAYNNTDALTADQIEKYSAGGDILSPLFSFANLVLVDLVHPAGFDLDNATVLAIARAWPRIEYLALEAGAFRHVRSRVTLEGLYAFAQHCPNLRNLEMTFDATVFLKVKIIRRRSGAPKTPLPVLRSLSPRSKTPSAPLNS
ncbi:hypothetical protein B0H17DRAFT_1057604 [Mycena rosella]|uniref:F-box domain-containing protein n=1 Tax=Mycena rosella TaxID=1033263 RepID=A0AAD7DNK1_MYCRO|nr:hypothetical protein B0H17DRAFT_1057604 [Mycena rosella]